MTTKLLQASQGRPSQALAHAFIALAYGVAATFLLAAFSKIFSFSGFMNSLLRLGWIPNSLVLPVALGVIAAELAAGFQRGRRAAIPPVTGSRGEF